MALRDHFRPPLSVRRHWHAFHNAWCTYLASHLNEQLPEGYFAEPNVQFGIEIDVATWEEAGPASLPLGQSWVAPTPTETVPISIVTDCVEIQVFNQEAGPTLAGAIELVSPANKDRPSHRDAFVSKCAAYVQSGVGLIIVDLVTGRHAQLHQELMTRLHPAGGGSFSDPLYAVAYRAVERDEQPSVDLWSEPLAIGKPLPTLPLWLRGNLCLRVDLEETYERTCREQRIARDAG
ncbi:MAG: DUF4058 family protein [Pirellulaceae bacterium]